MGEVKPGASRSWIPVVRQCFVTVSVALNIMGQGCVIGFSAILNPSLREPESEIQASPSQESWIASIIGFALLAGNFIITPLMDTAGRKKCHLLTIFPILIGWFVLLLAKSVTWLIIARFLQGVAMGMLGPLGSVIIGEMTDPKHRGAYLTSVSLALTSGVMYTHTIGTFFSWQVTALICSFVTFISLLMIIYTPETPPWLVSKGRYEEAREIFFWLRGYNERSETEFEDMLLSQKMLRKVSIVEKNMSLQTRIKRSFKHFSDTIRKPEFYKPILIMFHMYIMFQFAGINVISSYATDIMSQVVGVDANAKMLMVALDIERLICNILSVFLMAKMKRRTLLFTTVGICVTAYLCKGGYVYAKQNNMLPFDSQWIPITLIGIYMFSLAAGISSVPFAVSGELFPLAYRGLGGGISVFALSINFFVAVKCFPMLTLSIGLPLTYCLYASIVTYCSIVIWFMMPETKDRTLQDIEDGFRGISREDRRSAMPLNMKPDALLRRCSSQIMY